jgi:hypothetical protein
VTGLKIEVMTKQDIDIKQTKMEIERAASNAVEVIAKAASEAAKVVADAAAVSVKVLSIKNADDHDLLIELKTRMEGLKIDIKELKDGTSVQIAEHERRIFCLENSRTRFNTLVSVGIGILTLLVSLLVAHLFGIGV